MKKLILVLMCLFATATVSYAATIKAKASGNWSATATWYADAVPVSGDTADCNGWGVVMDVNTIPATGTLLALVSPYTAGFLSVDLSTVGNRIINATTITAGTKSTGIISVSNATYSLTINGDITGGSSGTAYGVYNLGTGAITIVGNLTGGSSYRCSAVCNVSIGIITITGNLIYSDYTSPYIGYRPVLTAGSQYYYQMGSASIKFPQQLTAAQVLSGVVHGDITGTLGIVNPTKGRVCQ